LYAPRHTVVAPSVPHFAIFYARILLGAAILALVALFEYRRNEVVKVVQELRKRE
jgi:hypothetical protein